MTAHNGMSTTCFLMLAMAGGEVTAAGLRDFMRREGEAVSTEQVRKAVQYLCGQGRPLVEKAERRRTRGAPYSYRLTKWGRAVLSEDCGDDYLNQSGGTFSEGRRAALG